MGGWSRFSACGVWDCGSGVAQGGRVRGLMPAGEVEMGDDGRGSDGVFWQSAEVLGGGGVDWKGD